MLVWVDLMVVGCVWFIVPDSVIWVVIVLDLSDCCFDSRVHVVIVVRWIL